jgi:hypothetical protein
MEFIMTFRTKRSSFSSRRRANSGIPGYDNQGWDAFGHPGSYAQPEVDEYGIDSDFGESVRKGPYLSGPPPASVGWMPDHPAVDQDLVEDYETGSQLHDLNLKQAMERKASKCIELAEKKLGRRASARAIEDLALSYMNLSNSTIQRKLASSFLAEEEVESEWMSEDMMSDDLSMFAEDVVQDGTGYYGDVDAEDMMSEDMFATHHMSEDDDSGMFAEMQMMARRANRSRYAKKSDEGAEQLAEQAIETAEQLAEEVENLQQELQAMKKANLKLRQAKKSDDAEQLAEEAVQTAEELAEEVETLSEEVEKLSEELKQAKKANARLAKAKKSEEDLEELSDSEVLEEEIKALKKANARLKNRLASNDTPRKSSVGRLASVLSDFVAEEDVIGEGAESLADLLAELEAEEIVEQQATKMASKSNKKAGQNDPRWFYQEEIEEREGKQSSKKAMFMSEEQEEMISEEMEDGEVDPFGLNEDDMMMSEDPRLASLFSFANEEEDEEVEEEEEEETTASKKASRLAKAKKSEEEVETEEEEDSEEETEEEEEEKPAKKPAKKEPAKKEEGKKASITPRPKTQQASVKTLGNISRTASDANELSKLWESAPDVSKFFS